jgi:hypothetical protein
VRLKSGKRLKSPMASKHKPPGGYWIILLFVKVIISGIYRGRTCFRNPREVVSTPENYSAPALLKAGGGMVVICPFPGSPRKRPGTGSAIFRFGPEPHFK